MNNMTRRKLLCAMASVPLTSMLLGCDNPVPDEYLLAQKLNLDLTLSDINKAKSLLSLQPAIDTHAHPGRFFLDGVSSWDKSVDAFLAQGVNPDKIVEDMNAGGLAVACFSIVGDMKSLTFSRTGITATRAFDQGEAWVDYKRQIQTFNDILSNLPLDLVRGPADIPAHKGTNIGALLTCEGSDFLEGKIERLQEVYDDGVRSMIIVHYRTNEVGDPQTVAPVHGGLTPFGAELIKGMNRLGMIIDLAHASFETAKQAISFTSKPVMLSHSQLVNEESQHPRLITAQHARLIADTGGIIGVWPAGITQHSLVDYVDEIFKLIDVVGINHVALGTDMDVNFQPVFDNYRQLPLVTALMLKKGLTESETAKILGANFIRLFHEVVSV